MHQNMFLMQKKKNRLGNKSSMEMEGIISPSPILAKEIYIFIISLKALQNSKESKITV